MNIARAEEGKEEDDIIKLRFKDIGRIKLNRKKQRIGSQGLQELLKEHDKININYHHMTNSDNATNKEKRILKPILAGAAISGLFAIFYDGVDHFRIKNISDIRESRKILKEMGFSNIYGSVSSIKTEAALNSLAQSDKRSNVV